MMVGYYGITDLLKESVLEGFSSEMTTVKMLITLAMALAISCYIHLVYRIVTKNTFYYKNYGISMSVIAVVTAGIILAMQSSIVISLGMVGALSIVRFRTAIKDPIDLLFLFWSIGVGIICGANLYQLAIMLSVVVTCGIILFSILPVIRENYLLIIHTDMIDQEEKILAVLKNNVKRYKVRSKNVTSDGLDMIIEVKLRSGENGVVSELREGISKDISVSLLMHDGQVNS